MLKNLTKGTILILIPEIAKLLGRDEQDLEQHIKQAYKNIKLWRKRILQQWGIKAYMRIINARRQKKEEGVANERVQI